MHIVKSAVVSLIFVWLFAGAVYSESTKDKLAHRKGVFIVKAAAGADVRVEQQKHEFKWGVGLTYARYIKWWRNPKRKKTQEQWVALDKKVEKVKKLVLDNFNAITFGSEIKWDFTDKVRGKPNYKPMDTAVDWAEKNGFVIRGHCLFWGYDRAPGWARGIKNGKDLFPLYKKRAAEVVGRYKGRLIDWDFRNETLNGHQWDEKKMGKGIHAKITQWVRKADPDVNICMNEFGVLSSEAKCKAYIRKCKSILKNGGVVDRLGCQGHYHGEDFNRGRLKRCLDMLARLKRPVIITEFNMPGQTSQYCKNRKLTYTDVQETKKAKIIADYIRICFEHPAVEGFYFWYPWENCTWINASALWSGDATPKPALHTYRKLVFDEWWTRFTGKTDKKGECRVPAFLGKHKVIVGGREKEVELTGKGGSVTVDFGSE